MSIRIVPNNYPTIQAAIDNALPGDEIHVNNGTYKEQISITKKSGLSIIAAGGNVILDGNGLPHPAIGFRLLDSPKIKISGFIIKGFQKGISVDASSNYAAISNNVIKDIKDDGIKIKADGCSIINNSIYNCADDGIKIDANNCSIENNIVYSNGEEGIEVHGDGNIFSQNTVKDNRGIGMEIEGNKNVLSGNIVKNNSFTDIKSIGTDDTIIFNNRNTVHS